MVRALEARAAYGMDNKGELNLEVAVTVPEMQQRATATRWSAAVAVPRYGGTSRWQY